MCSRQCVQNRKIDLFKSCRPQMQPAFLDSHKNTERQKAPLSLFSIFLFGRSTSLDVGRYSKAYILIRASPFTIPLYPEHLCLSKTRYRESKNPQPDCRETAFLRWRYGTRLRWRSVGPPSLGNQIKRASVSANPREPAPNLAQQATKKRTPHTPNQPPKRSRDRSSNVLHLFFKNQPAGRIRGPPTNQNSRPPAGGRASPCRAPSALFI